jgi:hypothetical protein
MFIRYVFIVPVIFKTKLEIYKKKDKLLCE